MPSECHAPLSSGSYCRGSGPVTIFSKPRLDRVITVGLVHPIVRFLKLRSSPHIPILMYHGICYARRKEHPYFETNTSPQVFAEQMQFLHDNGYKTTDLAGALAGLEVGHQDRKQVVITFDDGYRDFYSHAVPILMKYKFSASLFVVTELTREQRVCQDGREYMTWNEIREVHARGIRIGSHTATHPELRTLSAEQIRYELEKSKETIEEKLGEPIRSFSYPYAFPEQDNEFVAVVKQMLEGCGYENGVSTIIGTASPQHHRFFLPRLPVNSCDDLQLFRAKLEGGYDWLHGPQYLAKMIRRSRKYERASSPHSERGYSGV